MGSSGGSDASSLAEFLFGAAAVAAGGARNNSSPPIATLTSHAVNMTSDAVHCMEAMAAASNESALSPAAGAAVSASAAAAASAHVVWSRGHSAATTMATTVNSNTMSHDDAVSIHQSAARRTVVAAPAVAYSHAERLLSVPRVKVFINREKDLGFHPRCEPQPSDVDSPNPTEQHFIAAGATAAGDGDAGMAQKKFGAMLPPTATLSTTGSGLFTSSAAQLAHSSPGEGPSSVAQNHLFRALAPPAPMAFPTSMGWSCSAHSPLSPTPAPVPTAAPMPEFILRPRHGWSSSPFSTGSQAQASLGISASSAAAGVATAACGEACAAASAESMRVAGSLIVPVGPTWVAAELADAAAVAAAVAGRSGSRVKSGTSGRSWKGGWSGKVGAKSARRELPDLNDPAEEAVGEGAAGERAVADRGPRRSEGRHDRQLADRGPRRSWVVERGVGEGGLDLNAPAFVGDRVQRQLDVGQQRSTGFGSLMPDQAEQPSPFSQRDSQSGLPGQQHVADSAREQANPQGLHPQQRLSFSSRKGAMMPPQQQAAAGTSLLSETFESTQEPVQQTGMGRDLLTEIHLWQKQMEEEEQGASSKARPVESQAWGDDFRAPGADSRAWGADSRAWGADSRAWGADSQAWERVSQVYSQGGCDPLRASLFPQMRSRSWASSHTAVATSHAAAAAAAASGSVSTTTATAAATAAAAAAAAFTAAAAASAADGARFDSRKRSKTWGGRGYDSPLPSPHTPPHSLNVFDPLAGNLTSAAADVAVPAQQCASIATGCYSDRSMGRRWNRLAPVSGDELATQIAALAAADANADAAVGITSGIAAGIAVDGSMVRMPSVGNSLDKLPEQHEYPHTGEVSPLAKKVAELLGDIPFSVSGPDDGGLLAPWRESQGMDRVWQGIGGSEKNKFKCSRCDRAFPTGQALGGHMRKHYAKKISLSGDSARSRSEVPSPDATPKGSL